MNTPSPFTAHRDVLEAPIPESEDGQKRLLEELKNRGRSAVQASQWPAASHLYKKALDVLNAASTKNESEIAIIHSNLSLIEGKMNLWDFAVKSALDATVADPMYVKGWWRLGQAQAALSKYNESVESFETALRIEPSNKALQKELSKMKEKAATFKPENASDNTSKKATTTTPAAPPVTKKSTVTKSTSEPSSSNKDDEGEPKDTEFTKSDYVRGYKIVNGKKTSYFHNELSEDAKKLIGDIAPKKLDGSSDTVVPTPVVSDPTTSIWNQAGTWEERDVSAWAKENLEGSLLAAKYEVPPTHIVMNSIISVTKVIATGHASVAAVRGKKRYIYEYNIKIHWKFDHFTNTMGEGTIEFPDVDGTCTVGEPYDASNFTITSGTTASDNSMKPIFEQYVYRDGLRNELHKAIDSWVRKFQSTY